MYLHQSMYTICMPIHLYIYITYPTYTYIQKTHRDVVLRRGGAGDEGGGRVLDLHLVEEHLPVLFCCGV